MERLRIRPRTRASAQGMLAALSRFHAELLEDAEGCEIVVTFGRDGRDDGEIVAAFIVLAKLMSERGDGPVPVELNGREAYLIGGLSS